MRETCAAVGWEIRQGLVWERGAPASDASDDYVRCHENCVYGWKDGAPHQWLSDRCQTTALAVDGAALPDGRKPVDVLAYLMGNSTVPGAVLLDPFAGTGSTIIAAERTGRRAFLAAATPAECDVIRQRWTAFVFGASTDPVTATPKVEGAA